MKWITSYIINNTDKMILNTAWSLSDDYKINEVTSNKSYIYKSPIFEVQYITIIKFPPKIYLPRKF